MSCQKEHEDESLTACGVKDPVTNLDWLNVEYKQFNGGSDLNGIVLYKYEDAEIIEVQSAVYSSTNQHQYYCDGTKLNLDDPETFNKFREERTEIGVLYGTNIWKY